MISLAYINTGSGERSYNNLASIKASCKFKLHNYLGSPKESKSLSMLTKQSAVLAVVAVLVGEVRGHGSMVEPPARAVMHNYGFPDNPAGDQELLKRRMEI